MPNSALRIDEPFKLALILDNETHAPTNIKNILRLRPELENDVLLVQDYMVPTINPQTFEYERPPHSYLFFRHEDRKDEFMALYDELQSRHGWDISRDLLPQYTGSYVNGYVIPHIGDRDGPVVTLGRMEDFKVKWEWILANCSGKVQWSRLFWYFESQADAALYKLNFSK
jgi:hypothetical protein